MNRANPVPVAAVALVGLLAPGPRDPLWADTQGLQAPGLYDETVIRTFYLEVRQSDWWQQLEQNNATEENLSADLTVDGVLYPDVGVRFKGFTSYNGTGSSYKKSFNIEIDDVHDDQRVMGYRTLNLNNAYNDPSFMREVLYSNLSRRYIPSPRANFVRLYINGEAWGLYANVQQVNRDLIEEWFASGEGTRWRAGADMNGAPGGRFPDGGTQPPDGGTQPPDGWTQPPDGWTQPPDGWTQPPDGGTQPPDGWTQPPGGGTAPGAGAMASDSALTWLGSDVSAYEAAYDVRSHESPEAWNALIHACDILNNTPIESLADALPAIIDVDRTLWYLAVENVFVDEDGYHNKGADYFLYWEIETGRFHLIQHDGNEVMGAGQMGLGAESWGPFDGETDQSRPLIRQLLSIPDLRARYVEIMKTLIDEVLDLAKVEPLIERYRSLIRDDVMSDDKNLYSNAAFETSIDDIKAFVVDRQAFLLSFPELQ